MSLWLAISKKKYDEALNLIKENSELVNAVNEDGNSVLMDVLRHHSKPHALELIQHIMAQETFNLPYENPKSGETIIDAIIATGSLDILKLAAGKVDDFLINGKQLTYSSMLLRVNSAQRMYNRELETGNRSAPRTKVRLENFQSMLAYIKQATILHAFSIDNVKLLEGLEKLGVDPLTKLDNGTDPNTLLTEKTPKLKAWFEQKSFERTVAEMSSSQEGQESSSQSMKQLKALDVSIEALKAQRLKADATVMKTHLEKQEGILGTTVSSLK